MSFKNSRALHFFIVIALLFSVGVPAASRIGLSDEPQLAATLDKQTAVVDEEVHLNIKVTGVQGRIQAPVLPPLEGFEIFYSGRASHFSYVNGRSEALTEFNYVLIPRSVGRFIIDPIEVELNGRSYKTGKLEIVIEAARAVAQSQGQPFTPQGQMQTQGVGSSSTPSLPPFQSAPSQMPASSAPDEEGPDENIFLRVMPTQLTVYTNEQLILTYSILTRYDTRYEGFQEEPETSGFWIEEFPLDYKNLGRDTEEVRGRRYVRADVKKLALFPTAAGTYVVKPGVVKTSVQIQERTSSIFDQFFSDSFFSGGGLFARRATKILTTEPITIQVRPLPEAGKPESFKGAVGDFRMSTQVDRRVVKQNEAVTLTVNIEGQGNIETLSLPSIPEPEGTKVYESDTRSQLFRQENVIAGSKTFEIIFIPGKAGELTIPKIEFSFFNPRSARYIRLTSESYHIQVNPSDARADLTPPPPEVLGTEQKGIRLEAEDIHYIKERIETGGRILDLILYLLLAASGVVTMSALAIAISQRRAEYLEQNVSLKRTLAAKRVAREGLKHLERLSRTAKDDPNKVRVFYDESAKVLNQYLSDKLNLSVYGMTRDEIERELFGRRADSSILSKINECSALCDHVRYGQMDLGGEARNKLMAQIREIIKSLEKIG